MIIVCLICGFFSIFTAYENVALHKSTYQRYQFQTLSTDLTAASNAVDGLKSNLSVWGGQCVISENKKHTSLWMVDLKNILSIHHITIYYRTGNVQWGPSNQPEGFTSRFLGFSLYISNTTDKSQGKLCFQDTNFTLDTIPSVFTTTCSAHGRYVIYYNERLPGVTYPDGYSTYAFNELCEVEVFGCPEPGYYGLNCSIPCPDPHCRYCHIETGTCQGCNTGFQGHHCELECTNGRYGDGCEMICGQCADLKQCHHVNGTCLGGCQQGYVGEDCKSCENKTYGEGCRKPCGHCYKQDGCYHLNGTCFSGCEPGYGGDLCKSHNLAFNKPTYQQNQYGAEIYTSLTESSNAVDGLKADLNVWGGQCAISANEQTNATLWINLTRIYSIHHITIYYRTGNVAWGTMDGFTSRFLGFSLYISNTTDKSDGELCFKDTNFTLSTIPAVFNATCPLIGQYVIDYNERLSGVTYPVGYSEYAFNELCELEVYGCSEPRYYGSNCSIPCPDPHCRYCHMETGTCQGCEPGYEGHHCESECVKGKYGNGCESNCGHCADFKQCHHINGTCPGGCEQGYIGKYCKTCYEGSYGYKCSEQCGHCRHNKTCHYTNGMCLDGCSPGFQGAMCKTPCPHGFFGLGCARKCHNTCTGCNNINGLCDTGCKAGWKGKNCEEACDGGNYGEECEKICGNCREQDNCFHINGTCLNGCATGYHGVLCRTPCSGGKYGPECNSSCGHCMEQRDCHHVNGSCLTGCKPGFSGVLCNSQCKHGFHGENCRSKCGNCLNGNSCHHINGSFLHGCDPGYQGFLCIIEKCDTGIGTYVALAISLTLLAVALTVIIFQRRLISNFINERKSKKNIQNQEQIVYENGQHLYDISADEDEKHRYVTLDSRKQESLYQNIN